jgi:GT2 family glycosyltransferase
MVSIWHPNQEAFRRTDQEKISEPPMEPSQEGNSKQTRGQDAIRTALQSLWEHPLTGMSAVYQLDRARNQYLQERNRSLSFQAEGAQLVVLADSISVWPNPPFVNQCGRSQITRLGLRKWNDDLIGAYWQQIAENPADCVVLEGSSMPLVIAGLLYKLTWGAMVLVRQDSGPLSATEGLAAITINQLKIARHGLPDPGNLHAEDWLRLALDCQQRFDGHVPVDACFDCMQWLEGPRNSVDGAQLNALESLAPDLASPLMAARYWRWNQEWINWAELTEKKRNRQLVSIVIPVYGHAHELDQCIKSLMEARTSWEWEVVAVMNDESEENREVALRYRKLNARIRPIWPGENTQFALGCNLGFAASEGDWLVLMNNDCRATDGWLDGLLEPLQKAAVAASQPRLLKPDGTVQSLGVVFHDGQTLGYPLYEGLDGTVSCTQKSHRLQALTGACLAMRATDYARVRGMDCRYLNSQEDIDLCLRLLQLPCREYCQSTNASTVIHAGARAAGRFGHSSWSRHQFSRRWVYRIRADDMSIYSDDDITVEGFMKDHDQFELAGIGAGRVRLRHGKPAKHR